MSDDQAVIYCMRCDLVIAATGDAFIVSCDHELDEHADVPRGEIVYERLA